MRVAEGVFEDSGRELGGYKEEACHKDNIQNARGKTGSSKPEK